jgi:hypothetical protein
MAETAGELKASVSWSMTVSNAIALPFFSEGDSRFRPLKA